MMKKYTHDEIKGIYNSPLLDLVFRSATVHRMFHDPSEVQVSSLLSVKTGGCPEDCGYCPQAARYHTDVNVHKMLSVEDVMMAANNATLIA